MIFQDEVATPEVAEGDEVADDTQVEDAPSVGSEGVDEADDSSDGDDQNDDPSSDE